MRLRGSSGTAFFPIFYYVRMYVHIYPEKWDGGRERKKKKGQENEWEKARREETKRRDARDEKRVI